MQHIHPGCKCAAQGSVCACHMSGEWEAYVYKGSSFRPKADIKSGAAGLFHCVHFATGHLSKLYCKHCTGLVGLSTMTFSTFHTGPPLGDNFKWITKTETKRTLAGWFLLFNNFHFWPHEGPLTILLWHQTKNLSLLQTNASCFYLNCNIYISETTQKPWTTLLLPTSVIWWPAEGFLINLH